MTLRIAGCAGMGKTTLTRFFDPIADTDGDWVHMLTARSRRPNLLVDCDRLFVAKVVTQLMTPCLRPLAVCLLPGELRLPRQRTGTMLLHDVSALMLEQQIELYDWMSDREGTLQILAVTSTPLCAMVERGLFLECLFHRLNTVHLRATLPGVG